MAAGNSSTLPPNDRDDCHSPRRFDIGWKSGVKVNDNFCDINNTESKTKHEKISFIPIFEGAYGGP